LKGLTKRQQEILHYIDSFINTHRYSPSYREIMQHFGFKSLGTVYKHLQILKRKGVIENEKKSSRSIAPTFQSQQSKKEPRETELPFIGHVKGGEPISTFPKAQTLSVPASMVQAPDKTYVFRVMGDSLTDEHLVDGDLLLVEARPEANPGETVMGSLHHDEVIIRRYYPEGQYIRLISHSTLQPPYIIRQTELVIQGILVGLIRMYG
jgi:repressor LexA